MRLAAGANRTEPTASTKEVGGGASAASLLAELARPPSHYCFTARLGTRRSALSQCVTRREEERGYRFAVVKRLVNIRAIQAARCGALEGVNQPEQRDRSVFIFDAADRRLKRLLRHEYPLAGAHLLPCQVGVDLRGKGERSEADE